MNLADEMGKLPEPKTDKRPPYWEYWRNELWHLAQRVNPHNFMDWPCVYHTMLQDHWRDSIKVEAQYLSTLNVPDIFAGRLLENSNHPVSTWYNMVHQTYHIYRWQEATGQSIADMRSIYEFGGGYGAMALVCNRLGFKGQYYIYDLPEFALLQQWYLSECGVDNVTWVDKVRMEPDLFIACYSLSETDLEERNQFLTHLPARSYLFLYSNKFEQFDNVAYFQTIDSGMPSEVSKYITRHHKRIRLDMLDRHWAHAKIKHLPPESWYTWGW